MADCQLMVVFVFIATVVGTFIRRVFVKARRHFQTPVNRIPEKFRSLEVAPIYATTHYNCKSL